MDDTNHEVMDRVPERVLLVGRSTMWTSRLLMTLMPVPLGAVGESSSPGCVAVRPSMIRSAPAAFLTDPDTGRRRYRSGGGGGRMARLEFWVAGILS